MNFQCFLDWFEHHQGLGSWLQGFFALGAIVATLWLFNAKERADRQLRIERDKLRSRLLVLELMPSAGIASGKMSAVAIRDISMRRITRAHTARDFTGLKELDASREVAAFAAAIQRCDCLDVASATKLANVLSNLRMFEMNFDFLRQVVVGNGDIVQAYNTLVEDANRASKSILEYQEITRHYVEDLDESKK